MEEKVERGKGDCNSCGHYDPKCIFVKSKNFEGIDFEICRKCARELANKLKKSAV